MVAALNPREADTSRAYRLIDARFQEAEGRLTALEATTLVGAGEATLADSATSTNVAASGVASGDRVFLTPTSATAAAATYHVSAVTTDQFTITHDSTADTDKTFNWLAVRVA